MKNMIKRIIVGVAIGTILFIIKGGNVFADSFGTSRFSSIIVHYNFDVCLDTGGDFLCTEALEDTQDIKNLVATLPIYTPKSNEYLMLKEFDVKLVSGNGVYVSTNYSINLPSPEAFFNNLNKKTTNDYTNQPRFNNITLYNNFINYFGYKSSQDIEYTSLDSQYLGAYMGIQQLWSPSGDSLYVYGVTPSVKISSSQTFYDFQYSLQSAYTYNGSNSIIQSVPTFTSNSPSISRTDFLNQYKTNSYLAVVYPGQSLSWKKISDLSSTANWSVTTGSYSSNSVYNVSPTANETAIQDSLSNINKELIIGASSSGPSEPSSKEFNDLSNGLTNFSSTIGDSLSGYDFEGFLNALVIKPIEELDSIPSTPEQTFNVVSCSSSPRRIYFNYSMATQNLNKWSMEWPCMTNVYVNMPWLTTDYVYSLVSVWHLVIYGFLYYYLCLTWLNLIKYTITRSKSEIEVIEL